MPGDPNLSRRNTPGRPREARTFHNLLHALPGDVESETQLSAGDDGLPREGREGDEQLAADLDGFYHREEARYWDAVDRAEAARLATLCGGCVPGGTGPPCEEHDDDLDALWLSLSAPVGGEQR